MTFSFSATCITAYTKDGKCIAWTPNLIGVTAQGDTLKETLQNFREVLKTTLKDYLREGKVIPFFDTFAVSLVEIEVDVEEVAKEKRDAERESE